LTLKLSERQSDVEQKNYMLDELKKQLDELVSTRDVQVNLVLNKTTKK
jgi:hypothetical protein